MEQKARENMIDPQADLQSDIYMMALIEANNCNPNGDTVDNKPNQLHDGSERGFLTHGWFTRLLRDAVEKEHEGTILDLKREDMPDFLCQKNRLLKIDEYVKAVRAKDINKAKAILCRLFFDVRAIGDVMLSAKELAVKEENTPAVLKDSTSAESAVENTAENAKGNQKAKKETAKYDGFHINGPFSLETAISICPIKIEDVGIACSTNRSNDGTEPERSSLGHQYFLFHGLYPFFGGFKKFLAGKTHFTEGDLVIFKEAVDNMVKNYASMSRASGTLTLRGVIWWRKKKGKDVLEGDLRKSVKFELRDGVSIPTNIDDYVITLRDNPDTDIDVHDFGANFLDEEGHLWAQRYAYKKG